MSIERNNNYPNKGDKLFIPEKDTSRWLPSGIDDIFRLSEGYRMSAVSLYKEIKKREWIDKLFLACSMIFCFRQFLELRLKELTFMGKRALFEEPDFKTIHSLDKLYQIYVEEVLPKIDPSYNEIWSK